MIQNMTKKLFYSVLGITFLVFFLLTNFSYNTGSSRTVVENRFTGVQSVRFAPGIFYSGFLSKTTTWPNQLSVSYTDTSKTPIDYTLEDNGVEIKRINIRFGGDATEAAVSGIVQYGLPVDEREMINLHNVHRTPESLVQKRLATYTKECLQSSAQTMSSETHYSGGRATMAQDYKDQLSNGIMTLKITEVVFYDSIEKDQKRVYKTEIVRDANGQPIRKESSIKKYGITVADASITDVDYETRVDNLLGKKIDASTKASIAKQELLTAQQQQLTAKAVGEKKLVEIEYEQKQQQTKTIVEANTRKQQALLDVQTAELNKRKLILEGEGEAAKRKLVMQADGALDKKLEAWLKSEQYKWEAFSKYTGPMVPSIVTGNQQGNYNALNMMEFMSIDAARRLHLDLTTKK